LQKPARRREFATALFCFFEPEIEKAMRMPRMPKQASREEAKASKEKQFKKILQILHG
jgi:hypothetical protein